MDGYESVVSDRNKKSKCDKKEAKKKEPGDTK